MGNHPGWVSGSPSSLGPLVEIRCGHERNFALKWIFKVWPKALLTSQFSASKFINCLLVISSPNCLWLPNSVNKDFGPATRAGSSRRFLQSCGKGLTKLKQCPDRIGMSSPAWRRRLRLAAASRRRFRFFDQKACRDRWPLNWNYVLQLYLSTNLYASFLVWALSSSSSEMKLHRPKKPYVILNPYYWGWFMWLGFYAHPFE